MTIPEMVELLQSGGQHGGTSYDKHSPLPPSSSLPLVLVDNATLASALFHHLHNATARHDDDDDPAEAASSELRRRWGVLGLLLIIVCSIVGNVLVCLAVCWERRLQNMTNYFLMSLAIADLLVSVVVMPLGMIVELFVQDIKTKMQSFRTAVAREMTKVSRSKCSGAGLDDVYTPSYIHWTELQFLVPVIKKRNSATNLEELPSSQTSAAAMLSQSQASAFPEEEDEEPFTWFASTSHQEHAPTLDLRSASPASPPLLITLPDLQPSCTARPNRQSTTSHPSRTGTPLPRASTPELSAPLQPLMTQGASVTPQRPVQQTDGPTGKRRRQANAVDDTMQSIGQYFKKKASALPTGTHAADLDSSMDADLIWAKNLVNNLNKIKQENKKTLLQIQIDRLVQDAIIQEIENE